MNLNHNPRSIPTASNGPGTILCPLTKKAWTFPPFDKVARAAAQAEQLAHTASVVQERERLASRQLTLMELIAGIQHQDNRTNSEKVRDDSVLTSQQPSTKNPWTQALMLDRFQGEMSKNERAKYDLLLAQSRAWEEAHAEQTVDVDCDEAVTHANAWLDSVKFDASYTQSDIVEGKKRLEKARTSPDDYWLDYDTFASQRADSVEQAAKDADSKAAEQRRLARDIRNSGRAPVEPAPEVKPPEWGSFAWLHQQGLERKASEQEL